MPHNDHEHHDHAGHEHAHHAPAEGIAIDPVCHMEVEIATARYVSEHAGQKYYFCNAGCKRSFDKDPAQYLA
jgi:YHS domain-containing protein